MKTLNLLVNTVWDLFKSLVLFLFGISVYIILGFGFGMLATLFLSPIIAGCLLVIRHVIFPFIGGM